MRTKERWRWRIIRGGRDWDARHIIKPYGCLLLQSVIHATRSVYEYVGRKFGLIVENTYLIPSRREGGTTVGHYSRSDARKCVGSGDVGISAQYLGQSWTRTILSVRQAGLEAMRTYIKVLQTLRSAFSSRLSI